MTGTVSPALPIVGQSDSSEEPKIPSAIITLRDALNAVLTAANQLDGTKLGVGTVPNTALATLALSKLAPGTNAQIPISNGSSYVSRSLSDDVTIDNTGIATVNSVDTDAIDTAGLQDGSVTGDKLALTAPNDTLATTVTLTSAYQTLLSVPVVAGHNYLVFGSVSLHLGTPTLGGNAGNSIISLTYNGTEHATDEMFFGDTVVFPINFPAVITSGTTLLVKAKDTGSGSVQVHGADAAGGYTPTRITVVQYT